jgi:hypothetical protein
MTELSNCEAPLLKRYANIMEQLDVLSEARKDLEGEIIESMERDDATEWVDGKFTAVLKYTRGYYQDKLDAILEAVPESELLAKGALVPEHNVVVSRKWNVTKAKSFAKRGKQIQAVIDGAAYISGVKLTVTGGG